MSAQKFMNFGKKTGKFNFENKPEINNQSSNFQFNYKFLKIIGSNKMKSNHSSNDLNYVNGNLINDNCHIFF